MVPEILLIWLSCTPNLLTSSKKSFIKSFFLPFSTKEKNSKVIKGLFQLIWLYIISREKKNYPPPVLKKQKL